MKVVSPFARSYVNLKPAQLFRQAEQAKIREYRERIREVEHADFNPLVFTSGGMALDHEALSRADEQEAECTGIGRVRMVKV